VSIGNASGVFKAIIKYIAGVPQILLDFVKTINDENGYNDGGCTSLAIQPALTRRGFLLAPTKLGRWRRCAPRTAL